MIEAPAPSSDLSTLDYAVALLRAGVLELNEHGNIFRVAAFNRNTKRWEPCPPRMADKTNNKEYLRLRFKRHGKVVSVMSQRVVYTFHHGPIPDDRPQINHGDLQRDNNHPDNLAAMTQSENIRHSYANRIPATPCEATEESEMYF